LLFRVPSLLSWCRAAGTGGTTIQSFAIDSKYGRKAVVELMSIISRRRMLNGYAVEEEILDLFQGHGNTFSSFESFRLRAFEAMRRVRLLDGEGSLAEGTGVLDLFF
jgi:hypothetical protein